MRKKFGKWHSKMKTISKIVDSFVNMDSLSHGFCPFSPIIKQLMGASKRSKMTFAEKGDCYRYVAYKVMVKKKISSKFFYIKLLQRCR